MKLIRKSAAILLAFLLGGACLLAGCGGQATPDAQNDGPADSAMSTAEPGRLRLRAATYNIKNCDNGDDVEAVAAVVRAQNLDVLCVQEADMQTDRSDGKNIAGLLAEACGLPYYHFYRAMAFQGGGYGIAILSKYALTECQAINLQTNKKDEPRVLAKAVVKTQGGPVTVYNTHLSFESDQPRLDQLRYINEQMTGKKATLLMGDFNIKGFEEYAGLTALQPINTAAAPFISYRGDDEAFRALDNIFTSPDVQVNESKMVESDASDHNMLMLEAEIPV